MKKIFALIAIVALMAVPAYADCGCKKKANATSKSKATESRGTVVSAANQKAHEAAKTEKEAVKAEVSQSK